MSKIWEIIPQNEVEASIRSRIKCYLDGFPDDIPFNMDIMMEAAIKKAKAESNIVAVFDKAGFETRAEYFDHKALVKVRLDDSGWTMFWVEYDDTDKEGYLDSFVSTAIHLKNSHSKTK